MKVLVSKSEREPRSYVVYHALGVVFLGCAIADAFVWHDWSRAGLLLIFSLTYLLVIPSVLRSEWGSGYARGRTDAFMTAGAVREAGGGIDTLVELEIGIGTGALVPCAECKHLTPAQQSVNDMHASACSLHPNNVADAQ